MTPDLAAPWYDQLAAYLLGWGAAPFPAPAHAMVPLARQAGPMPATPPPPPTNPPVALTQHQRVHRWAAVCVVLGVLGLGLAGLSVTWPWALIPAGLLLLASYGAGAMAEDAAWLIELETPSDRRRHTR